MKTSNLPREMHGIIPPLVTPLLDNDRLDLAGLERLIEHVIAGGVHGIFLLGTTGEAPSLAYKVRHELLEHACRMINGRVPVFAAITDASFSESLAMAAKAADAGASALVLAPPFYYQTAQPELVEYFEHLIPRLPLPLLLYNMPAMTKISIAPDTIERIIDMPNFVGIKDSSGDMVYFHHLLRLLEKRQELALFVGPEELLAESVLLGGSGGVNGGANFWPQLYVQLYNAARNGELEKVRELHRKVIAVGTAVYGVGKYASSVVKGTKCALNCMGICSDYMAEPFHRFRDSEREIIRRNLVGLGLLEDR